MQCSVNKHDELDHEEEKSERDYFDISWTRKRSF